MRDILEDAHEHRDDGYGRAQKAEKREMPKRFYKAVSVAAVGDGFAVLLDGKKLKSPSKIEVNVPNEAVANVIAKEFDVQKTHIDASTMPFTRLINSTLEANVGIEPELIVEIVKYAGTDLLLYRSDSPKELVEAQELHWDKVLAELAQKLSVKFLPTVGIIHKSQPDVTLKRLSETLNGLDKFTLMALASITSLSGSGLLSIALFEGLISSDEAWNAAHVDEDFNDKIWGADVEAQKRRKIRRQEFDIALKLIDLMR